MRSPNSGRATLTTSAGSSNSSAVAGKLRNPSSRNPKTRLRSDIYLFWARLTASIDRNDTHAEIALHRKHIADILLHEQIHFGDPCHRYDDYIAIAEDEIVLQALAREGIGEVSLEPIGLLKLSPSENDDLREVTGFLHSPCLHEGLQHGDLSFELDVHRRMDLSTDENLLVRRLGQDDSNECFISEELLGRVGADQEGNVWVGDVLPIPFTQLLVQLRRTEPCGLDLAQER